MQFFVGTSSGWQAALLTEQWYTHCSQAGFASRTAISTYERSEEWMLKSLARMLTARHPRR